MEEFTPSIEHRILQFLSRPDYQPLRKNELWDTLNLPDTDRATFRHILHELEHQGKIIRLRKSRWGLPTAARQVAGTLHAHPQGFGFVDPDDLDLPDVFIPEKGMSVALDGDRVLIRVAPARPPRPARKGRRSSTPPAPPPADRLEGYVVRVIERGQDKIVGLLKRTSYYWYVIADQPAFHHTIRIREDGDVPCQDNHKVVVQLDEWNRPDQVLTGLLIEDLGPVDAQGVDVISIMRQFGLDERFPADADREARQASTVPNEAEMKGRQDLRSHTVFTIDPFDAKDFDDAVSIQQTPEGHFLLGVHIADVAHYVQRGTAVDQEAFLRGNSVYMVDRTITMLPPYLTAEICSLRPQIDRLTHSVELTLDTDGRVLSSRTFPSVIHSQARLNYDQVQAFFDRSMSDGIPPSVVEALTVLRGLARILRQARMKEQSLDISLPEIKCMLDPDGQPVGFRRRGANEAYQLIEECMLLANQAVALAITLPGRPALYRVHEPPDDKQWERMALELASIDIPAAPRTIKDINELGRAYRETPLEFSVSLALLRNQKRALYSTDRSLHFGLGFTHYTHFTSPIRRYPDLVVHRLLKALERRESSPYSLDELGAIASHCSRTEEQADEAEDQSLEIKRLAYYEQQLEQGSSGPMTGHVVSMTPKGLIVELDDSLQRGLLPFAALTDDVYTSNDDRSLAVGRRKKSQWHLGQAVTVQLAKVNAARRWVDFLPEDASTQRKTPPQEKKRRNRR